MSTPEQKQPAILEFTMDKQKYDRILDLIEAGEYLDLEMLLSM